MPVKMASLGFRLSAQVCIHHAIALIEIGRPTGLLSIF